MTESEAKTKWCPMVRMRISDDSNISGNAIFGSHEHYGFCIGSECMMWRWHDQWLESSGGMRREPTDQKYRSGYCGLAGALIGV